MQIIGIVVISLSAILFYYLSRQQKEELITVQDLLGKDAEVSPNGIIRKGNMFRCIIEVSAINMPTKSQFENDAIWLEFRTLVNTLNIHFTLLSQSQYIDIHDYSNEFKERYENNYFLTPELKKMGEHVFRHYQELDEDNRSREYKYFIILHYNPYADDSIDSGVQTGSHILDDLLKKMSINKTKMSKEEIHDLAIQVLDEATHFIFHAAHNMNMMYRRLDRLGVYNFVYSTLQRELAKSVRLSDASLAQSFTAQIDSLTTKLLKQQYNNNKKGA